MQTAVIRSGIADFIRQRLGTQQTPVPVCPDYLPESEKTGGIVYQIQGADFQYGIDGLPKLTRVTFLVTVGKLTRAETDVLVEQLTDIQFRESTALFQYIQLQEVRDVPYDPNTDKYVCTNLTFTGHLR